MSTFTVTIDGEQHEVDQGAIQTPDDFQIIGPNDIPDGFVKQSVMDAKIDQRLDRERRSVLKEAHTDESVRKQVLSEYGIELDDDGNPKGLDSKDIDIDKEREKWENNNLQPVKSELEETKQTLNKTRSTMVRQSIRGAFAGKAKDEYLDSEIGAPYVEQVFAPKFRYNPDIGEAALYDEENETFELHPNGKQANSHGYVTPDDYIKLNRDSKLMSRILKDDSQGGSGFQKGGGGGDGNTITREEFDNKSPKERKSLVDEGVEVVDN